jgi:hypothetical protein
MTEAEIRAFYGIDDSADEDVERRKVTAALVLALALRSQERRVYVVCQPHNVFLLRRSLKLLTAGQVEADGVTLGIGPFVPGGEAWDTTVFHSDMLGGAQPRAMVQ